MKRGGQAFLGKLGRVVLKMPMTFLTELSMGNIWLALKRAVKKHDERFHEEIHPSSSSGCRNLRATTQGYAVMTN
jgi:hypothetical protein